MVAELVRAPLSVRERYAGLLYGALVADALALAPHWIYDQEELAGRFGRVTDFQAPAAGSYHAGKELGGHTHYGDQALILMESLEACGGNFVMEDFARRWRRFAEESTAYHDHATKDTLAHLQEGLGLTRAGSASTELGGASRLAPVLVALRNEEAPVILAAARAQTALTHATPVVLDAAEFLTRSVFLLMRGVSIPSALQAAAGFPYKALTAEAYLRRAEETRSLSTPEAVKELGQSCGMEKAFPSMLAILLRHGDDPETALIENVMAGGDSAARGMALGTLLGAAHGRRAIPERWIGQLRCRGQVETFLQTVGLGGDEPGN
jgi:ADP-ribosylglycohydrolase